MAQINKTSFKDTNNTYEQSDDLFDAIIDGNNELDTRSLNPSVIAYATATSGQWRGIIMASALKGQGLYLAILTLTDSGGAVVWSGTIPLLVNSSNLFELLPTSNRVDVSGIGHFRIEPSVKNWLQFYENTGVKITVHSKVV